MSVCGFTPRLCLTSILSELSLTDTLFYTRGRVTRHHVTEGAAFLEPHWPERHPPHPLLCSCPTPPLFFLIFSLSFMLFLSIFLIKQKCITQVVTSLLFQLTGGIFCFLFSYKSDTFLHTCDGFIRQDLVWWRWRWRWWGEFSLFEAEILAASLVVVWTTETAASGRVWVGGVGECRGVMGQRDLPIWGCRLEASKKSGAFSSSFSLRFSDYIGGCH